MYGIASQRRVWLPLYWSDNPLLSVGSEVLMGVLEYKPWAEWIRSGPPWIVHRKRAGWLLLLVAGLMVASLAVGVAVGRAL